MTCLHQGTLERAISRAVGWLIALRRPSAPDSPLLGHIAPRWAITSAAMAPLVLTAGWLVADSLQPPSYSPMQQTVSVMAGYNGADRWVMTGTLLAIGCCYLVTAYGLAGVRQPARIMLIVAGLCSFGIATSPEAAPGPSDVHLAWTAVGAIMLAAWPAVAGWSGPRQPFVPGRRTCVFATIAFTAMLAWVVLETQGGNDLGLAERACASVQTCWPLVVAIMLRWRPRPQADAQPAGDVPDGGPQESAGVLQPGRYTVHGQQQEPF